MTTRNFEVPADRERGGIEAAELRDKMRDIADNAEAISALADKEGRELTPAEEHRVERMSREFDDLLSQFDKVTASTRRTSPNPMSGNGSNRARGRMLFRNMEDGSAVRAFNHRERMSDIGDDSGPIIGQLVKAIALGDMSRMPPEIKNAVNTSDDSAVVPTSWSSRFIDLARANSVCAKAGAESINIDSNSMKLGRLVTDPSTYWRGETVAVTASKPVFGSITVTPKVCAVLIPVSLEWLEDSLNGAQLIEEVAVNVLAAAIDKAALTGDGTGATPTGVTNNSNVISTANVGTPTDYSEVSQAVGEILERNYPGEIGDLSWVRSPQVAALYDALKTGISGDNTPLTPTPWVQALKKFHTTSLEGSGSSPISYSQVVGDFRQMLLGFRNSGIRLQLLNAGTATDATPTTWNAVSQLLYFVRAYVRFDTALMQPRWFSHLPATLD